MGKAYAHRSGNRKGDFYSTPKSLVWVAEDIIRKEFPDDECIFEPAAGRLAIFEELEKYGYACAWDEPYLTGVYDKYCDYLLNSYGYSYVITNPPFSLWDEFVLKAKTHCKKFMFIGPDSYRGTLRNRKGVWDNLKAIYTFNRYVDYQTPYRTDGLFHVGCMTSSWYLWDMDYTGGPTTTEILDVQQWAKLGAFSVDKQNKLDII